MIVPSVPNEGPETIENVSESPSASLPLSVIVTVVSSFVVADVSFATGGVLHVTSGGAPLGSEGAAGEQTPVCVSGNMLVAVPLTGYDEPVVFTVPHAVRTIVP